MMMTTTMIMLIVSSIKEQNALTRRREPK